MIPENSVVYFLQGRVTKLVKIGYSGNFKTRLSNMQVGSPDELVVLKTIEADPFTEKSLHRKFWYCHHHGEWFSPHPELLRYIESLVPERTSNIQD